MNAKRSPKNEPGSEHVEEGLADIGDCSLYACVPQA
jgi:hypothetical protein